MSRPLLRIYWLDDEPDRLKESARDAIKKPELLPERRADLKVVKLGGDKGIAAILEELGEEKRRRRGAHLIIIDQMLQLTNADAYLQRGSSLAAAIRDKDPTVALVGVTGADLADVGELQKQQFIEFFVRDSIVTGEHIPDLYAIGDGYAALVAFHQTTDSSSTVVSELCKLVKCPPGDCDLFASIIPGAFKSTWDNGTRHTFARWVWHCLLGRPGLIYDELEAATLLGLKVSGFHKLKKRLAACEYKGVFASASRPRWWVSRVREKVRELTQANASQPLWSLGRKLIGDAHAAHFSKCHGRPGAADAPTVVAFSDGTLRKRVQAWIGDTQPLGTDSPPFGFEQRRIYSPVLQ